MKIKPSLHRKIIRRLKGAQKDGFELLHDAPPVIGTQEKYSDGKGKYRTANGLMHDIFNYRNKRVYGFALQKGYFVRAHEKEWGTLEVYEYDGH